MARSKPAQDGIPAPYGCGWFARNLRAADDLPYHLFFQIICNTVGVDAHIDPYGVAQMPWHNHTSCPVYPRLTITPKARYTSLGISCGAW